VSVRRPAPRVLVVSQARTGAALRLVIWAAVVGAFVLVLAPVAAGEAPGGALALLVLVPLVLLPYLVEGVGVLVRGREHVFDGEARALRASGRAPVAFARIREVRVAAVNATCEEAAVIVVLDDGSTLPVHTGARFAAMRALGEEIASLTGAPLAIAGAGTARLLPRG